MQVRDATTQLTTVTKAAYKLDRSIVGRKTCSRAGEDSKFGGRLITLRQLATCHIFRKRKMPMQTGANLTATLIMKPLLMLVELLRRAQPAMIMQNWNRSSPRTQAQQQAENLMQH